MKKFLPLENQMFIPLKFNMEPERNSKIYACTSIHIEYHKKCMSLLSQSRSGSTKKLLVPLILHAGNVRSIGHCRFSLVLQIGRHKELAKFSDVPLKTEPEIKTAQDNSRIQICEIDNMLCSGRATSRFL